MADGQFAALGLVLLGLLARIDALISVLGTPARNLSRGRVASAEAVSEAEIAMSSEDLGRPVLRLPGSLTEGHAEGREKKKKKKEGRQEVQDGPKERGHLSSGMSTTVSEPHRMGTSPTIPQKATMKKKGPKGRNAIEDLFSGIG